MKSGFQHQLSVAALALPERSVPPWLLLEGLASVAQPGVAGRGKALVWISTSTGAATCLICWACRASAPLCPVPGLHPPGSLLVALDLREHLGFLRVEGHQAPVQASTGTSVPACSGFKPCSCAWGMGSPPPCRGWQGHCHHMAIPVPGELSYARSLWGEWGPLHLGGMAGTLLPQGHSCPRSVGLCWVLMGSQSCFGRVPTVSPRGGGTQWSHLGWRWLSLEMLVTGCARAGGPAGLAGPGPDRSTGGISVPGDFSVTPQPLQALDPRLREQRVSGGWVTVTPVTDPGASCPSCRNGNKQPF